MPARPDARPRRGSRRDTQMTPPHQRIRHHFTVDVEEHFQVSAMEPYVARSEWDDLPSRVESSTRLILDQLARNDARGTFFTLGWIAQRHPDLVKAIHREGHEVASHGWGHERITRLTPAQFRESVRDSKAILEDITGRAVLGYRAPSFSIVRGAEWALEILIEEGYRYDSSLFPVRRSGYGFDGGERDPHVLALGTGTLHEFPPATLRWGGRVLPAGGGAYFRLFPPAFVGSALRSAERRGVPATFYIHPWELDPGQPRLKVPLLTRVRHYGGLDGTAARIKRLLLEFEWKPIAETFLLASPEAAKAQVSQLRPPNTQQ
ncbi:MAG: hypothetical protein JWM95_581 [Gemmatimonadetes bacterium]|nr:hypothetical protein [Gemmatimonadota bacterium]